MQLKQSMNLALLLTLSLPLGAFEIINTTDTHFDRIQLVTRNKKTLYRGKLNAKSYAPISSLYFKAITRDLPLTLILHEQKTTTQLSINSAPQIGSIVEFSDRWMIERDTQGVLRITEINKQR